MKSTLKLLFCGTPSRRKVVAYRGKRPVPWHFFLICYFVLLSGQIVRAQLYGPPAAYTTSGFYVFGGSTTDSTTEDTGPYDNYGSATGPQPAVIYSNYTGTLGGYSIIYDPTTQKFFQGNNGTVQSTDVIAVSGDFLNFLGLDAGVTVRSTYSITGIWDGNAWRAPSYVFLNPNGVYVAKFLNIPDGLIFQVDSSPYYLYRAGTELVLDQTTGSWTQSNVFAKQSPQSAYIHTSTFSVTDSEAVAGVGYYVQTLTYDDGNADDSLTIHRYCDSTSGTPVFSGDLSGQIEGVDFSGVFDPLTWAVTGLTGIYNVGFNGNGIPSIGPPYISANGELVLFSNTDLQGTDHYTSPDVAVDINTDGSVNVQGPYDTSGWFSLSALTFDFGGDPNMSNFFGLYGNGDPIGLPLGLTMIFGSDTFGGAVWMSNGQVDENGQMEEMYSSSYTFHRPDGTWGCRLVGLPYNYWFVIADDNHQSQIYVTPSQPEMVVNAAMGWPLSDAFPTQLYVNTETCSIQWQTHYENPGDGDGNNKSGGVTYQSADNLFSISLNWAWNDGNISWSWTMNGQTGDWDGANEFSSLPSGIRVGLNPPSAPAYGPAQVIWNGSTLTYDGNLSVQENADTYVGNGIRITIDAAGRVAVLDNDNPTAPPLYQGTYNATSNTFTLGAGNFGTIADKDGSGRILSTSTSNGNLDISGNVFSLGSWINGTGDSINGMFLSFAAPAASGQPATVRFGSTVSSTDWLWSRAVPDGSTSHQSVMLVDSSNQLSLFPSESDEVATIVLNPGGGSAFHGPVRVQPQGDIPMLSPANGPTPP